MHYTREDIDKLDRFYRMNLINSMSGFKSANLIATKSKSGAENVAVFNSVLHIGANPPLLGFVLRPLTVPRHTYENIIEKGFYTINAIHSGNYKAAHHSSAKYPRDISEFYKARLEPEYHSDFYAPFVKGSPIQIGLEYVEEHVIKANDTILVIGAVKHVFVSDELLNDDGFVDLTKAETATISGLDGYSFPEGVERLAYQRPKV